jgi:hypothetical protein
MSQPNGRGKRLELGGRRQNVKCQSSKSKWNSGMMEKWNDGINAKNPNNKLLITNN